MQFQGSNNKMKIKDGKLVKLVDMDGIYDVITMDHIKWKMKVTKLDKDHYRCDNTGEVKEYVKTENRSEGQHSVKRTLKKIRYLVNKNFRGRKNELFVTLTYAENMTDPKILYQDFKKFIMRLKYKYGDVDYINVIEPQGRGAWHCHVLMIFREHKKIYVPNDEMRSLWGQGFVKVNALSKDGEAVTNIGAYLSSYLADIEINDPMVKEAALSGEVKTVIVDGQEKKYLKGGRLPLYPTGINIYRKSRGIIEPTIKWTPYRQVKKITRYREPDYFKKIDMIDDNGKMVNSVYYESYNLRK